jgi:tight adherence protein C
MATHLRQIDTYGFDAALASDATVGLRSPLGSRANAAAESLGRYVMARVGSLKPLTRQELVSAGYYALTPEALHGYRALAALLLPVVVVVETLATGGNLALGIILALAAGAASWFLFSAFVRHRSEQRLSAIDRDLPELIDVLTATVEAGLGFAGSLQLVASRFEGPLGNELKLTLQEQSMGLSTTQALSNTLERCDTAAMRSFVRSVLQGETLGVSIGTMMRNLAIEMRARRRQAAHERVQKAPVKMLFPLVFLIFPSLLIVLLYPAVHELLHGFSRLG